MNEDALNTSVRKFLKQVGVTSQREIEKAVRDAVSAGRLKGDEATLFTGEFWTGVANRPLVLGAAMRTLGANLLHPDAQQRPQLGHDADVDLPSGARAHEIKPLHQLSLRFRNPIIAIGCPELGGIDDMVSHGG